MRVMVVYTAECVYHVNYYSGGVCTITSTCVLGKSRTNNQFN